MLSISKTLRKYFEEDTPTYHDHMEQMLEQHHDDQLREKYAQIAFQYFIQKYFERDFEAFALDAEMDVPECISALSWNMADQMLIAKK